MPRCDTKFGEAWLVSRYNDVSALLKDPRLAKDPANALSLEQLGRQRNIPAIFRPLTRNMLSLDDPDHARLKRLVQAAFTPRRMEQLATKTATSSEALLDRLHRKTHFDLIAEYALPLPVTVISDLLGIPLKDRTRFARWSRILIRNGPSPLRMLRSFPQIIAFMRYLKKLIAMKREVPGDDITSTLVELEGAGDRLDSDELLAMIGILLTAGHETTTNLIGNSVHTLLEQAEALDKLRSEKAAMGTAVEELLRFTAPVEMATQRYTREEMEIAGVSIPQGALVFGVIASGNRDGGQFCDPDKLLLSRDPNRHLTFGEGGHYCVGAALARMEGRVAIPHLLERFPNMTIVKRSGSIKWRPGIVLRGLDKLEIATNR